MTPARTPYEDTRVPVARSQEQIRRALRDAGADGVQFQERFDPPKLTVRFLWRLEGGRQCTVRLEVTPLPPEPGARSAWRISGEQRERQAWRSLAWYLDAMLKAAAFGLLRFEDVFLSFIEDDRGQTIGDYVIPALQAGPLELPRSAGE